ncbi:MAG: antitoxin [Angelakisella sp.]|nr:antitoxin [Angelakisella sp.]
MNDILKITTPLINKNQIQSNKQVTDPTIPFNLQDISKVIKPNPQSELLSQNNGMIKQEEAPTLLMNLLKDASVTVGFLKNIFMLQEIIRLLPVNNQTITQELNQLFDALLIEPDFIVAEMVSQENTSTVFKGELFNILRQLVAENPSKEMREAVASLLKSLNSMMSKGDVMDAVANSLLFLSESLQSSKSLSDKLLMLSLRYRQDKAEQSFNDLKSDVLSLLKEVKENILFSPKMEKVVAITVYNLSRFNSNPDFLSETVSGLLTLIDNKEKKEQFLVALKEFYNQHDSGVEYENSKIMDVLAKIIAKQSHDEYITLLNQDKIEKIISSLLSSPCNFTPLLHFVVPVKYQHLKSFAEIWINPNGEQDSDSKQGDGKSVHMLLVFDIEGIGQFEAELFVRQQSINFSLFCPPAYTYVFSTISDKLNKAIAFSNYKFEKIHIDNLERPRSLMEVFKSLPYKRTGVDVKI